MSRPGALSERKMLRKIQWRLVAWLMAAFVLFEAGLAVGAYDVLKTQLIAQQKTVLAQGLAVKIVEVSDLLHSDGHDRMNRQSDERVQVINPIWVVNSRGEVVQTGASPIFNPLQTQTLIQRAGRAAVNNKGVSFAVASVGRTSMLIGIRTLYNGTRYIGYFALANPLTSLMGTLHKLFRIDLYLGVISIGAILLLTLALSGRALVPIRHALVRQRNFVNDAAHELRTPLAILRSTLELLQEEEDVAAIKTSLQDGLNEVDYLSSLVADLSTLARMESGAMELDLRSVDMTALAQSVMEALAPLAEGKSVRLILENSEPALLRGDPVRLRQLLLILFDNAIKYNVENGEVRVNLRRERQGWLMRIQDTGSGIAEEDLPRVFDRFYRSVRTASKQEGSGLGLAIAAWIADRHRGKVTVASSVGQGTVFQIWLPTN